MIIEPSKARMLFEKGIRGSAGIVAKTQLLLRHHFARQLTRCHLAYIGALLSRFNHGVSRTVVLRGDGRAFGVELIQRRIVRNH